MSFLSPPSAPNPYQTSQTQLGFNQQAAQKQQQMNMINQYTPYGSLNYSSDPNAPGGYSATQTLSPVLQQLLGLMQQGQVGAGNGGIRTWRAIGWSLRTACQSRYSITNQPDDELAEPVHSALLGHSEIKPGIATTEPGIKPERCRLAECNDVIHQGYRAGAESVLYPGRAAGFQSGPYPVSTSLTELCIIDGHEPAAKSKLCECSARTGWSTQLPAGGAKSVSGAAAAIQQHDERNGTTWRSWPSGCGTVWPSVL